MTPFDFENPSPAGIAIPELLHNLTMVTRWAGNVQFVYTVGQHCLVGARQLALPHRIHFLLHDVFEAISGDIRADFKLWAERNGGDLFGAERRFLRAAYAALLLPPPDPAATAAIELMDARLAATEYRDVVRCRDLVPGVPTAAPLRQVIKFMPQPKVHDQLIAEYDAALYHARRAA